MLVIRLARIGRRNKATFRVVLQEKSQAPLSKTQETLGSYNPHLPKRADQIKLKKERIMYWLAQGAQPSNTVHNMLVEFEVIKGDKKRVVQPKIKKQEGTETSTTVTAEPKDAKPTTETKTATKDTKDIKPAVEAKTAADNNENAKK